LDLFRACFSGLPHIYGTYDPPSGDVRQVKRPVTDRVFLDHLQGRTPYGVYLLFGDQTRAVVADFDADDPSPPLAFLNRARQLQIEAYLEKSKHKGWHVWVFLALPGVTAAKARVVMRRILGEAGAVKTEIFPKQDRLNSRNRFGNFINAPLYGTLVPQGRTIFVNPTTLKPYPDQWELLAGVQRVLEPQLEQIIVQCEIGSPSSCPAVPVNAGPFRTFGLAPCAQRMLSEGVTANQRVACFRLAVHLKKAGVPSDIARASLGAWAMKNRPEDGKRVLTANEVAEQVEAAYVKDYRGCGCEDPAVRPFCDCACALYRHNNAEDAHAHSVAAPAHASLATDVASP
jgi:hypothetical protein